MLSSRHHSIIYKNDVVVYRCFYKCWKLHFGVPCGRFFHSAKAAFYQPPQHHKQEYSFIPFHESYAIAFRVLADASLRSQICHPERSEGTCQPYNASAQSTTSTKTILFIPFGHTLVWTSSFQSNNHINQTSFLDNKNWISTHKSKK